MTAANISLEEKYRLTRKALVKAGLDMTGGMDALYRDWRRWRDKLEMMVPVDSVAIGKVDEWWARHLVQFRCLVDPLHVTARAVRAQKDSAAPSSGRGERSPRNTAVATLHAIRPKYEPAQTS
jgi:hypothetical protein